MFCPKCAHEKTAVLKTIKGLKNIRMRRCEKCGYTWITEEKPLKDKDMAGYVEYIDEIDKKA
nr:MAG TPA: DNA-directed RNA polymerase [Caudoviricetes sp.]